MKFHRLKDLLNQLDRIYDMDEKHVRVSGTKVIVYDDIVSPKGEVKRQDKANIDLESDDTWIKFELVELAPEKPQKNNRFKNLETESGVNK